MSATLIAPGNQFSAVGSIDRSSLVQSWYPLARSADLPIGATVPVDVMGQSLVVFRSQANELGVIKRHCCHMGGDLSRGTVTKGGIRCPIHGWEFSVSGERVFHKGQQPVNGHGCQQSLHCTERHGVVFGFFGPRVLFDIPAPSEPVFHSSVIVRDFDAHYDVPTIFGFDREHFATVHHREVESLEIYASAPYHIGTRIRSAVTGSHLTDRIMRLAGLNQVDVDIGYWGANLMLGHHRRSNTYALLSTLPLGENRLRMFISMLQRRPEATGPRQWLSWLRFKVSQPVIRAFIAQDEQALSGVRFDPEQSSMSNNPGVERWLEHQRSLPHITPTRIFRAD
jgi:phenylpropionate dioxygenase-like ring-hydroxylating dioxygenase large terminal subunit